MTINAAHDMKSPMSGCEDSEDFADMIESERNRS